MFQTTNQLWNPPNPSARGTTSSFFASDGSFFGRNFSTTGSSCGKRFAVRRQQGTLRSSGNEKKGEVWEKKHGLDGGWPTPLKNMSSSVGMMTFPIYEKKTCSKPPISMDWSFQKMELVSQSMGNCYSWFKIWLKFDLSFLRQSLEKHLRARCTMILAWPLRLCLWLPLSLTLANVSPACENIEHQIQ